MSVTNSLIQNKYLGVSTLELGCNFKTSFNTCVVCLHRSIGDPVCGLNAASPTLPKVRQNGQQNRVTRFVKLLQNELNSDVARFTTMHQTCVTTDLVDVGCEK